MYRFLVVIEKANNNYSAYSPDLSGCVATGVTREEAEQNMHEAIELHGQGLIEDDLSYLYSCVNEFVLSATKTNTNATAAGGMFQTLHKKLDRSN